eukprot:TRINITY_DN1573_c0_g1_i1.p1 TRINITY_DN1573_c0_g1~~TRINITY_DN1573_c0_g1_i1.p1  ORF type:complete len:319 (+),score=7.22 TRINITY_DN1573_c0_g1_i1:143-958(+)
MYIRVILAVFLVVTLSGSALSKMLIRQKMIDKLKAQGVTWKIKDADRNLFKGMTLDDFKGRLKSHMREPIPPRHRKPRNLQEEGFPLEFTEGEGFYDDYEFVEELPKPKPNITLPEEFDARVVWPNCSHPILDQGNCSGCWALGIANLVSHRFCIHGLDVLLSPQDIMECTFNNSCCTGGVASRGYKYLIENGTVDSLCKPYDIQCGVCRNTTNCTRYKCKPYSDWYSKDVNETKTEIILNGPVQDMQEFVGKGVGTQWVLHDKNGKLRDK